MTALDVPEHEVNIEARHTDGALTPAQQNQILQMLSEGSTIKTCSEVLGITTYRIRKSREKDEQFAEMFRDAYETGTEVLEEVAWQRATEGVKTTHYDRHGNIRSETWTPSDRLMEILLKGRSPLKYRDSKHTVTHEGGFKDTVELKFNSVEAKEVMTNVRKALGLGGGEAVVDGTASPVESIHPPPPDGTPGNVPDRGSDPGSGIPRGKE